MKETPYELLKDNEKKQLGKNEEAKITIYNALPCKEYERFSISNEETIDSGFTRFNAIVTSLKSLDPDYSSKNHVRKYLRAFPLKWRAKVYEMVLDNDGVVSKTTKENVKSLALKAKVTREQTSDDSDSQGESDEEVDEEEAKAFNLLARNFQKFSPFQKKGYRVWKGNLLVIAEIGLERAAVITSETKMVKARSQRENATIAALKAISLVNVESRRKTKPSLEDHGAIAEMVMNNSMMKHVSWISPLKSLLKPKPSYLVEDDKINEPESQDLNGSLSLQVNVSDEGYPKSLKEARDHPITQVIVELNERTLRSKTKQA
ncbi:hypothetical protein Tco_0553828 [Tanacetum coccineum]